MPEPQTIAEAVDLVTTHWLGRWGVVSVSDDYRTSVSAVRVGVQGDVATVQRWMPAYVGRFPVIVEASGPIMPLDAYPSDLQHLALPTGGPTIRSETESIATVLGHGAGRAGLIAAGMVIAGDRKPGEIVRYAVGGAVAIEGYVLLVMLWRRMKQHPGSVGWVASSYGGQTLERYATAYGVRP